MRKTLLLSPLILIFLAACSPQAYQVNPQPDVSTKPNEIPESQQEDYMRIIGDLRWDKLTTAKDWETRFPGCLKQTPGNGTYDFTAYDVKVDWGKHRESPNPKCNFTIGGLQFYLVRVSLSPDPTGKRSTRIDQVIYNIPREDQDRAFAAAIKEKYSETEDEEICSKYSCFQSTNSIRPTPYTTSILDSVKVDPSAF